jgi:hypothetical protein
MPGSDRQDDRDGFQDTAINMYNLLMR